MARPKDYSLSKAKMACSEELPRILGRLENDLEIPMLYYKKTGNGNWASVRMIMPIIESLSSGNLISKYQLLRELGISHPKLFWVMYRHGLSHNDTAPQMIMLEGEKGSIGWGFNWRQITSFSAAERDYFSLNPSVLYENLKKWVDKKSKEDLTGKYFYEADSILVKNSKNPYSQEYRDVKS